MQSSGRSIQSQVLQTVFLRRCQKTVIYPAVLVGYLLLLAVVAFLFVLVSLAIGRLLRAWQPTPEKQQTYECGEPPIGSPYVRFDLRFYVVALLFIIFDVEIAFFFPWAVVFGKTRQLAAEVAPVAVRAETSGLAEQRLRELGVAQRSAGEPSASARTERQPMRSTMRKLGLSALADIGVFFGVLLVGFAYLWHQGDLEWVRPAQRRGTVQTGVHRGDSADHVPVSAPQGG